MSKDPDVQLKQLLFDGWELLGFQHVMTTRGTSSDYSILLGSGADLALYTVIYDGQRLSSSRMHLLTRDAT
jgi:hypothetical protein